MSVSGYWSLGRFPSRCSGNRPAIRGYLMLGILAKFDCGPAMHLCVYLAGCVREVGEAHMLFLSDASSWFRRDAKFAARQREPPETLLRVCQRLCDSWPRIVREWRASNMSPTFEFAARAPLRFVCGGVGCYRILTMAPRPASWDLRLGINRDAAIASGIPYARIDATLKALQRIVQRSKSPFAGGGMSAFSSSSVSKVTLPSLSSYSEAKAMFDMKTRHVESGKCRYRRVYFGIFPD